MRYSKDSIVISETADKPILRTVYEAGHVTFEQLHSSLHPYATARAERNSLAWRVRRLVRHGFLESRRVEGMEPALSLGESGELYLQSFDGAIVERRIRSKGGNARSQVWHDVQLFTIQLALRRAGVVLTWQSEAEVRAQNRVASLRFVKEYDAVVTFRLGELQADVALEFERTVKSADAYLRIFSQLNEETLLVRFLYLVPDSKSQLLLRDVAPRQCPRIYAALTHEFRAQPATAGLLDLSSGQTVTLATCLS